MTDDVPTFRNPLARCETCVFWERVGDGAGRCHRLPPPWPMSHAGDWCGEWRHGMAPEDLASLSPEAGWET